MKSRGLLKGEDNKSVANQDSLSTSSLAAFVHREQWGGGLQGSAREGRVSSGGASTAGLDPGELGPVCSLTEAGVTLPAEEIKSNCSHLHSKVYRIKNSGGEAQPSVF